VLVHPDDRGAEAAVVVAMEIVTHSPRRGEHQTKNLVLDPREGCR
jgi:hypothetical protein